MKIDLHCHTRKVKKGDPDTREVSVETFGQKILNADVKIVAITNHNLFDIKQYEAFRDYVKDYCSVWPGVELDAHGEMMKKGKFAKFHIIIISNPTEVTEFNKVTQTLLQGFDVNEGVLDIKDICKAFEDRDVLFIPHYLGKTPAISDDDLESLKSIVTDSTKVFTETTDSSIGVLINNDFHALVGSDVRDWEDYEQCMFSDLRLPVSSFEQFCMLAKRDVVVIDTLLNKKKSYEFRAKPHAMVNITLKLYEDVNVIFGQKGTGKSEILKSLNEEMVKEGLRCQIYIGSQKDEGFKTILSPIDMKRSCDLFGVDDCSVYFEEIMKWEDTNPTLFQSYVKWYSTRNNNANKKRMKLTDAVNCPVPGTAEYDTSKKDRYSVKDICEEIRKIDLARYFTAEEIDLFYRLMNILDERVYSRLIKEYSEIKAIQLTNYSIETIKALADKKTDTVSKPSTTGFKEYAQKHLQIKKCAENILQAITTGERYDDCRIGELEGKGAVYVRKLYRMLCEDSRTAEFSVGIKNLRKIKKQLEKLVCEFYKTDISASLAELSESLRSDNITSADSFIGLSKVVVDSEGNKYEPSNGEKGILLLQQTMHQDADAYLFDEPELGMGNSYIDATIRPQITDLAKRHKLVVIATHNANLAVRTLPYVSIFRKYDNGNYYTYIGNPFRNELVNICDSNDTLNWTFESMHTLEGGKEAFYERKEIYESGSV